MFEQVQYHIRDGVSVGLAVASLASLSACAEFSDGTHEDGPTPVVTGYAEPKPALERCFDKPQPVEELPELPPVPEVGDKHFDAKIAAFDRVWAKNKPFVLPKPISLHFDPVTQTMSEAPAINTELNEKLESSNVKISTDEQYGSGFKTTAPDGSEVVITAAHVVNVEDLSGLHVTNNQGEDVGVTGGCYMFEDGGKFSDLLSGDEKAKSVDVAVLKIAKPLGGAALKLARAYPTRGTWLTFVNNQADHDPTSPAVYTAMTVSQKPSDRGDQALTGLDAWQKLMPDGAHSYAMQSGGSGGLVVNSKTEEVVGISTAASRDYYDAQEVKSSFDVTINAHVGSKTGIMPKPATISGVKQIRKALFSGGY